MPKTNLKIVVNNPDYSALPINERIDHAREITKELLGKLRSNYEQISFSIKETDSNDVVEIFCLVQKMIDPFITKLESLNSCFPKARKVSHA